MFCVFFSILFLYAIYYTYYIRLQTLLCRGNFLRLIFFFSQFVKLKDHKICKIYKIVKSKGKGKMKILKRLAEVEEERDL
jgi:hypothetical protein